MAFDSFAAIDADTRRLRAAMTVPPPPGRLWVIDRTIRQLKQHGIWQRLDVLWFPAAHSSQAGRLNWKTPGTFTLTEVNSPTFTVDRGYAGNGTTSYLDTGFILATHSVQATATAACAGVYLNGGTTTPASGAVNLGVNDFTNSTILPRGTSSGGTGMRGRINSTTTNDLSGTLTSPMGLYVLDRPSNTTLNGYDEGVLNGTVAQSSAALPVTYSVYLGANNSLGPGPSNFSDNRIAAAFMGGSLTAAQHAALYRITQNHLASMGAAV